jgi:uncharacterized membrane protein
VLPEPNQPDPSITVPQPGPKSRFKAPGILIAISAALALLGCGLCSAGGMRIDQDSVHPVIVDIGTIAFWLGILGFAGGVLWFLVEVIAGPRKGKSQ